MASSTGLADLFARDAVGERALDVTRELVAAAQGGQRRDRDQAPVTLGEPGPLPDVTVQNRLAQFDELRGHLPDLVTGSGCGWRCAHGALLSPPVRRWCSILPASEAHHV
jgi:hypothetical protein